MLSFNGKEELKTIAINRIILFSKEENILTDLGLENELPFKEDNYLPEWLVLLIDTLSEKPKHSKIDFLKAIPIGVDLEQVKSKFMIIALKSNYKNFDHNIFPKVKKCLDVVIELYETGKINDDKLRKEAISTIESARSATESARSIEYAVRCVARAATWTTARTAEWITYWSAESADRSARSSGSAVYEYFSKELLKLLKECK